MIITHIVPMSNSLATPILGAKLHHMRQLYTLHTHTIGFDGRNSVQEMVDTARTNGFKTIGISNHFIVHPTIKQSPMYPYSVRGGYSNIYSSDFDEVMARFVPHYQELENLRTTNSDIQILRGMEVDFFPNMHWQKNFEKCLNILRPDYIIGSCHFIEYNNSLLNSHDWQRADADTQDILLKNYWNNVANAARSGLFTWMAHLDLPKKVNMGRENKWQDYENYAVESIATYCGATEINTGLYRPDCYEPYPSTRILQMIKNNNVAVLVSDDAHAVNQIGRHFDDAEKLIHDFNLQKFEIMKQR